MKPNWLRLGLLAAGLLMVRLILYAFITGHVSRMPTALCQWDCKWYVHTAVSGYDLAPVAEKGLDYGQANWAFLPFYPLLIHVFTWTGLNAAQAGFIISNLCFFGFMLIAYRYLSLIHAPPQPMLFFGFLTSFPYGFYFSLTYTESLYALLAIAAFTALASGQAGRSCLYASLLGVTRVTGILILPGLVLHLLHPVAMHWRHSRPKAAFIVLMDSLLPLAVIPLGLALYGAYLYLHIGDALAFFHVQAGWDRTPSNPLTNLFTGLFSGDIVRLIPMTYYCWQFYSLCGFGGLLLSAWIWRSGRRDEAWFLGITVLVAASTSLISLQRYILANPIFILFFYILLSTGWRRRLLPYLIIAGALLQLRLIQVWLHGYVSLV